MATCSSCGGIGGTVTVGGWIRCGSCGGSGQQVSRGWLSWFAARLRRVS